MRNIAYILAFLLVCPTLLFATQTDDNAAVLKRLDDIINKKETFQVQKEKAIDALKMQIVWISSSGLLIPSATIRTLLSFGT